MPTRHAPGRRRAPDGVAPHPRRRGERDHTYHGGERLTWGVISDLELVTAALASPEVADAGDVAVTEILTVDAGESLERAAQLMGEHQLAHLLVVDAPGGVPVGVLSSLDVAGSVAWGEV